jgi:hypothetical protein
MKLWQRINPVSNDRQSPDISSQTGQGLRRLDAMILDIALPPIIFFAVGGNPYPYFFLAMLTG